MICRRLRALVVGIRRADVASTVDATLTGGHSELVVQDVERGQALLDDADHTELFAAIRRGMESAQRGEVKSAEQVFNEIKANYGISD